VSGTTANEAVDKQLKSKEQIIQLFKENSQKSHSKRKMYADQFRTEKAFNEGC
jgi:hypothetical protein